MHKYRQKNLVACLGFLFFIQIFLFSNVGLAKPVYSLEDDVIDYPYVIRGTFEFGFTDTIYMVQRDSSDDSEIHTYNKSLEKRLRAYRYGVDIGWIQLSKFWCKYFGGYPAIGTGVKFTDLEGQGWMVGLLFYFAPQFSYFSDSEFRPRIELGCLYMKIPHVYQKKIKRDEIDEVITNDDGTSYNVMKSVYLDEPYTPLHDQNYRDGIGLESRLGFDLEWRLSPNWVFIHSYGIVYIPELSSMYQQAAFDREAERERRKSDNLDNHKRWWLFDKDKDIFMFTTGIGVGYLPRTSEMEYQIDKLPTSIVKITGSYAKKMYDRIADYGWSVLLTEAAKKYESGSISDIDVQDLDSVEVNPERYETFSVLSLNLQWAMKCYDSHAFVVGSEFILDGANAALMKSLKLPNSGPLKWAFAIGHDFLHGNFSFGQQIGFYVLNSAYSARLSSIFREVVFFRFNFDYKISGHWILGVAVRNRLEVLYDDMKDPVGNVTFNMGKFYGFSMKIDYPEIYVGYSF